MAETLPWATLPTVASQGAKIETVTSIDSPVFKLNVPVGSVIVAVQSSVDRSIDSAKEILLTVTKIT